MAEPDALERARQEVDLSISELWIRYFAVGGTSAPLEIEAFLYGALVPEPPDRDMLAVALNERFSELGRDHPIPYTDDEP
jgi:hypothetical protein